MRFNIKEWQDKYLNKNQINELSPSTIISALSKLKGRGARQKNNMKRLGRTALGKAIGKELADAAAKVERRYGADPDEPGYAGTVGNDTRDTTVTGACWKKGQDNDSRDEINRAIEAVLNKYRGKAFDSYYKDSMKGFELYGAYYDEDQEEWTEGDIDGMDYYVLKGAKCGLGAK